MKNPSPAGRRTGVFPLCDHSYPLEIRNSLSRDPYPDYNFKVNQVESAFMPLRSILLPSHTAKAMGTDIPALNWVSLASPVSNGRFTTTRQVGPVYPPPLLKPLAFRSSTELTRSVGSDMMLPDQIPGLKGPRLRPIRSG